MIKVEGRCFASGEWKLIGVFDDVEEAKLAAREAYYTNFEISQHVRLRWA